MTLLIRQLSNVNSRYFLSSEGINIEYRRKGNPDHDTIVLVHGLGTECRTFLPNIDFLAEKYQVLAISLRGHGLSDKPKPESLEAYSLEFMLRDIIELTWSLGIQSFHYVGHSLGGILGYELLVKDPMSLLSLITFGAPASQEGIKQLHRFIGKSTGLVSRFQNRKKQAESAAKFVSTNAETVAYLREEIFYGTNWNALPFIKPQLGSTSYLDTLKDTYIPVLFIESAHDFTSSKGAKRYFQHLLDYTRENNYIQHTLIEKAGHLPNLDKPSEFNRVLVDFIDNV